MERSLAKRTFFLAAMFGLFWADNALAAEAADVIVAKDSWTTFVSPAQAPNSGTAMVVTQNNRQTNLQKTPTSILVMGIEAKAQHRNQR